MQSVLLVHEASLGSAPNSGVGMPTSDQVAPSQCPAYARIVEGVAVVTDERAVGGCGAGNAGGCDLVRPVPGGSGTVDRGPCSAVPLQHGRVRQVDDAHGHAVARVAARTLLSEPDTEPDAVVQLEPTNCSTSVCPPLVPTATQWDASAHTTPASEPATATGVTVQLEPFHCSISVCLLLPTVLSPTATQNVVLTHATWLSSLAVAPPGTGVAVSVQAVPFHCSRNGRMVGGPSGSYEPAAKQNVELAHATPLRGLTDAATGLAWSFHTEPFQRSVKTRLPDAYAPSPTA